MILPDHLHCIWTLPGGDDDFSTRWRQIKAAFSRQQPRTERRSKSRVNKSERGIWQRRYWEHAIRDDADYRRHMDLSSLQPGEAWVCHASGGLALFIVSSVCEAGRVSG